MSEKVFGTKEWAKYSANSTIGCSHNCVYCYARDGYEKKENELPWTEERTNLKFINTKWNKKDGVIMFPTQHDITPNNINDVLKVLDEILKNGNDVLIVSKPHIECIEKICNKFMNYKNNILFRFTIGSSKDEVLKIWEPGAPNFNERIQSLKLAYDKGFNTSVSCEPLLDNDLNDVYYLVNILKPFVTNSIWIGKMNYPEKRVKGIDKEFMEIYLSKQNDENILNIYNEFKNDSIIKWKESIKEVVGLEIPKEKGLDI